MIEIKFLYEGGIFPIQCNKNEKFKSIFNRFQTKIENNSVYYLYKGNLIDKELKIEELIKEEDINNINILANNIIEINNNINKINKNNIVKSKYVICPECKEKIRIKINDYKIKLYNCKNGHNIDNILLEEYENTQEIDISEIKCKNCNINNIINSFDNDFYVCNTCKKNICPLCISFHNKNHSIINYENKEYICEKHNKFYIKYCNSCKINICLYCDNMHNTHEIISYENIFPDIDELENKIYS